MADIKTARTLVLQSLNSLGKARFRAKLKLNAIRLELNNEEDIIKRAKLARQVAENLQKIKNIENKMDWELNTHKELLKGAKPLL